MNNLKVNFLAVILVGLSQGCATAPTSTPVVSAHEQAAMSAPAALQRLKEGNERFLKNIRLHRNWHEVLPQTTAGQYPFAAIVSCMDSRASSELIFDLGLGDVFNVRVAGNVINDDILGSLEYATKVAGVKLVVVLGHSHCGAVKGAIDKAELGHLTGLVAKIQPAVDQIPADGQPRTSKNEQFLDKVSDQNVHLSIARIKRESPILKQMVESGQIDLVGGMYNLATGKVEIFH
jgi:carbonic anhydrase